MKKILRVLFSRCAISLLFFIVEIVGIILFVSYISANSILIYFAMVVINVLFIINLINRDVNPEFKISWTIALSTIPILGGVLYLMFYSRKMTSSEAARVKSIDKLLNSEENRSVQALAGLGEVDVSAAGRAMSILNDDICSELYRNSKIEYFPSGEGMYESMLKDLAAAEKFIFLEYFIIAEGVMWQGIYDILKKKAKEGVVVRLIYDDVGCMKTLPRSFQSKLLRDGIGCRRSEKVTIKPGPGHNNRNHRKITVIDGKIAYTGGVNIADEYINAVSRFGHWKDGGVRAEGKCALGFMRLFLADYYLSDGIEDEDYEISLIKDAERSVAEALIEGDGGFYIPFGDGPAPLSPEYASKNAIMNIINRAEKYLYVTTPYLIIDYDLTQALRGAAKRGVDVRLITPGIPDKKIIKVMTKSTYPVLISAGVRIFEYTPGFIHEKLIISDDCTALVGTVNLDCRSLVHNFENALWIYGSPEIMDMRDGFIETISKSREIGKKEARLNIVERVVRILVRMFAPLL